MEPLEARVLRLEKSLRTYRRAFVVLVGGLFASVAIGAIQESKPGTPEVLRARKFEVVANDGTPIVELGCEDIRLETTAKVFEFLGSDTQATCGYLNLKCTKGKGAVRISMLRTIGAIVQLTNEAGEGLIRLGHGIVNCEGLVARNAVSVMDEKGRSVVELRRTRTGGGITVLGQDESRVEVSQLATGNSGGVAVHNRTGETVVTLCADEYGNGLVGAWNREGKGRTLKPGP